MRTFELKVVFDTELDDRDLDAMLDEFYNRLSAGGKLVSANLEEADITY